MSPGQKLYNNESRNQNVTGRSGNSPNYDTIKLQDDIRAFEHKHANIPGIEGSKNFISMHNNTTKSSHKNQTIFY